MLLETVHRLGRLVPLAISIETIESTGANGHAPAACDVLLSTRAGGHEDPSLKETGIMAISPTKNASMPDKPARTKARRVAVQAKAKAPETKPSRQEAAVSAVSLPVEAQALMPSAALLAIGLLVESELLMGIALGSGISYAAKWLPEAVTAALQPILNNSVNACYSAASKTGEMLGEAAERIESVIAGTMFRGSAELTGSSSKERLSEDPHT